jgi:uncharacterized delta-60 repeat protein/prepilin-type N-terminal cleavage/methylation domain-containing protein
MNKTHKVTRKGFTLLEILLVIAAIGILAAIVLVAINPNRQIAQARNAERRADINTIYKALEQYLIDNQSYTVGGTGINTDVKNVCKTGTEQVGGTTSCTGKVDLRVLVPNYIAAIPTDPAGGEYIVSINSCNNRISVSAPDAQLSQSIAINPPLPLGVSYSNTNFNTGVATTINPTINNCSGSTITYAVTAGTLPAGITLNTSTGALSTNGIKGTSNGTIDTSFNPGSGSTISSIFSTIIQSDNKLLIGGNFSNIQGVVRNGVARLNTDGTLDTTFANGLSGISSGGEVRNMAIQSDGKIIIGGYFTSINGISRSYLARLNTDGTLDAGFNPNVNNQVYAIRLQSDGKVIIGGSFTSVGGTSRNNIARLNSDGSLDTGFNANTSNDVWPNLAWVWAIAIQGDGKILLGGIFGQVNGVNRNRIARLNSNGTLDTGFDPGSGANADIYSIVVQDDGKIMVGGSFTSFNSVTINSVARLQNNGDLDTTFVPANLNSSIWSLAIQSDGKVLVGNYSTNVTGKSGIIRLNGDGSIDSSFNVSAGVTAFKYVFSIALAQDNKIVIGGNFTDYNSTSRNGIARIGGLVVSGFPTNITIQASSSSGETASQNLTLTVN